MKGWIVCAGAAAETGRGWPWQRGMGWWICWPSADTGRGRVGWLTYWLGAGAAEMRQWLKKMLKVSPYMYLYSD